MTLFKFLLIFVILPVITAALGFPIGVFLNVLGKQKCPSFSGMPNAVFRLSTGQTDAVSAVSLTAFDGVVLRGEYHDIGSKNTALLFHGYRSHPLQDFSVIAQDLISHGFNVLLCCQRAHGVSGGKRCGGGQLEKEDVLSWISWAETHTDAASYLIYGVSMGGATVGYAAPHITSPRVKALVIDSAFVSFHEVMQVSAGRHPKLYRFSADTVRTMARLFSHVDIRERVGDALKACRLPVLFLYGYGDETVPEWQILENYQAAAGEKRLLTDPRASHGKAFVVGSPALRDEFYRFIHLYI